MTEPIADHKSHLAGTTVSQAASRESHPIVRVFPIGIITAQDAKDVIQAPTPLSRPSSGGEGEGGRGLSDSNTDSNRDVRPREQAADRLKTLEQLRIEHEENSLTEWRDGQLYDRITPSSAPMGSTGPKAGPGTGDCDERLFGVIGKVTQPIPEPKAGQSRCFHN